MGGTAALLALAGAIIIGVLTYIFDSWVWNGLFHATGIGYLVGFAILAIISIIVTILAIYGVVAVLIIGIVFASD
jgi:hypothetical protein